MITQEQLDKAKALAAEMTAFAAKVLPPPADWLGRERCGSCRYWERREGTQLCPQPRVGRCHRFPSLPDAGYGTAVEADLDWCGEFSPRPGATPEGKSRYEV